MSKTRNKGDIIKNIEISQVLFECPICHKKKKLSIPSHILNNEKELNAISIPKGLICEHTFQSYIDRNLNIRDYLKIDFELNDIDFYYKLSEDLYLNKDETSILIKVTCPRCGKNIELSQELVREKNENAHELLIDKSISGHCGHIFYVYLDNKYKILGYSNIKNINENEDLKDILSKL